MHAEWKNWRRSSKRLDIFNIGQVIPREPSNILQWYCFWAWGAVERVYRILILKDELRAKIAELMMAAPEENLRQALECVMKDWSGPGSWANPGKPVKHMSCNL